MVYDYYRVVLHNKNTNSTMRYIFIDWDKLENWITYLVGKGYCIVPLDDDGTSICKGANTINEIEKWDEYGYEIIK